MQFGTSITSGGTTTKHADATPSIVGDRLGIPALNVGFPGSCIGLNKHTELNPVSLCNLVESVVSGDWTMQDRISDEPIRQKSLFRLKTASLASVTHAGFEYGTNDFHYDRPIGADDDRCKETFKGALNYSIQMMGSAFPKLKLFLITPSYILTDDDRDSDVSPNRNGIFLKDYVDAMVRIAELNHIPCLDMWRTLGVNRQNYKTYLVDGTHPNDLGAEQRGYAIASFMNSIF